MPKYSLQIQRRDGTQTHTFGEAGSAGHAAALDLCDNWRSQPPENYYVLNGGEKPVEVFVRDIKDARVVVGNEVTR